MRLALLLRAVAREACGGNEESKVTPAAVAPGIPGEVTPRPGGILARRAVEGTPPAEVVGPVRIATP